MEQILIRISGTDRIGLTAEVMSILAKYDAQILDIGQADIHSTLSLGILIRIDEKASGQVMKEIKGLKSTIESFDTIRTAYEDIETMIEMAEEDSDEELIQETGELLDDFKKKFESFRIETLLSGEFDSNDATVKINAGTGGTEACHWVSMVYRMYTRWAESHGFEVKVLDILVIH